MLFSLWAKASSEFFWHMLNYNDAGCIRRNNFKEYLECFCPAGGSPNSDYLLGSLDH